MKGHLRLLNIACAAKAKWRQITLQKASRESPLYFSVQGGSDRGLGIFVESVEEGSKAAEAGLKRGDQVRGHNAIYSSKIQFDPTRYHTLRRVLFEEWNWPLCSSPDCCKPEKNNKPEKKLSFILFSCCSKKHLYDTYIQPQEHEYCYISYPNKYLTSILFYCTWVHPLMWIIPQLDC